MSRIFTLLVAGDNPSELVKKYSKSVKGEKFIKYHYLDADKLKQNNISLMEEIVKKNKEIGFSDFQLDFLRNKIKQMKDMSSFEFYKNISSGLEIDNNGDAWSEENPNGKYDSITIGKSLALPFILNDDSQSYQALKKDIAWDKIHMVNTDVYDTIWQLIVDGKEPNTESEKKLYENFKDKDNYFMNFKDKNEFVLHNCSFFHYAYLDENGWIDIDSDGCRDVEWTSNFMKRFVEPLDENAKLTIYECSVSTGK